MSGQTPTEGTLGFLTYILVAGAVAVTFLLGGLVTGSSLLQDRLDFPSLGDTMDSGVAFVTALVAFLVMLPLLVAGVALLFGRRAGISGTGTRGAAAVNALVGVPVAYLIFAVALLLVSGLVGEDGQRSAFSAVLDLVVEGFMYMLVALGPLVGLAVLVAHVTPRAFAGGHHHHSSGHGTGHSHAGDAHAHQHAHQHGHHDPGHVDDGEEGRESGHHHGGADGGDQDMEIDCPRCGTRFVAGGPRPLRIACPNCGKSGTIQ